MARILMQDRDFRWWMTDSNGAESKGITQPTEEASRFVTVSALASLWASARAHGKYVGNDLVLRNVTPDFLDSMAGVPGLHKAMVAVGWAVYDEADRSVTLPNFRDYNSESMTQAERSKAYRDRQKNDRHAASRPVTARALREEKRREENKKNPPTPLGGKFSVPGPEPCDTSGDDPTPLMQALYDFTPGGAARTSGRRIAVAHQMAEDYGEDRVIEALKWAKGHDVPWAEAMSRVRQKTWKAAKEAPESDEQNPYEMDAETAAAFSRKQAEDIF